jgi:hypothetical protein
MPASIATAAITLGGPEEDTARVGVPACSAAGAGTAPSIEPQCLHFTATARIASPQSGQGLVAGAPLMIGLRNGIVQGFGTRARGESGGHPETRLCPAVRA